MAKSIVKYSIMIKSKKGSGLGWEHVSNHLFENMKKDFAMGAWEALKAFNPKDSYKLVYLDKKLTEHIFQYHKYHNKPS